MDDFYTALGNNLGTEKKQRQLDLVRKVFDEQDVEFNTLSRLTDEKLKEVGITQLGLREAILAVLGK